MKKVLIASGIAALAFASIAAAQGYTFSSNLTVGSTGPDVVALQTWLVANGYSIPAISSGAAAKGYFGSQTKTAVMAYQAAHGVPNTGFVGPLTRAALNGGGSAMTSSNCPAGYTCTSNTVAVTCPAGYTCTAMPGTMTGSNPVVGAPTGITTPGVTGIMSVTQGPISASTEYAGQTQVPILDARIQAQYSDLAIQSVTLDLGTSTSIYNFVYSKIYVVDPSTNTVLATVPLNPSTVVQNGSDYVISLTGFNFIIPKGTYKDLQFAADLYNQINNQYLTAWAVGIPQNGIRSVDGAGVNQYGPITSLVWNAQGNSGALFTSGVAQTMIVNQSLITNASANISLDASSPLASAVGVTNTTNGQYLGLPVLVFDVNSQGDTLHLHNVTVNFNFNSSTGTASNGSVNAAYLFQGSTPVASAAVSNNQAVFTNITDGTPGASIPLNTTVPYTIKVDVSNLNSAGYAQYITASTSNMTIYNSLDSNISPSSLAQGNTVTVAGQGAVFSLSGTPTISRTQNNPGGASNTNTIYSATFNINATAIGENVVFNLPSVVYGSFGTSTTGMNIAQVYQNGTPIATTTIASFSAPSNTTVSSDGNTFTLAQNQSVTIPVTYSWQVTNSGANTYALQLNGIRWAGPLVSSATTTTAFMSGQTAWRTASQ